ncbi:MAG: hypothetical protein E6Q76_04985 [Rhizobium sp.]|nr:MAG: hypothetical protein E6Q76_04985 [Rhizobium sp.]
MASNNDQSNGPVDGLETIVPGGKARSELLFRIKEELAKESDRGCALVAAAYLESELHDLLRGFLVQQNEAQAKALFDFNGPLGTFSSKIKMSYALGLISAETQRGLDALRKIRNEFAHLHEPVTFGSDAVKQRTNGMLEHVKEHWVSTRDEFTHKVLLLSAAIHLDQANTFHRSARDHEDVPLKPSEKEHRLEVAARRIMAITAPEITFEQAMETAEHASRYSLE